MTMGENVNVKFSDVAGLSEEKEELEGMVDFLKDPAKYTKLGARIRKVSFLWDLRVPVKL